MQYRACQNNVHELLFPSRSKGVCHVCAGRFVGYLQSLSQQASCEEAAFAIRSKIQMSSEQKLLFHIELESFLLWNFLLVKQLMQ